MQLIALLLLATAAGKCLADLEQQQPVTVATVQIAAVGSVQRSAADNRAALLSALSSPMQQASRNDATVIVLPEAITWAGAANRSDLASNYCETLPLSPSSSPLLSALAARAASLHMAVVVNFCEHVASNELHGVPLLYNSAALLDANGRLAASYRKSHLFGTAALFNTSAAVPVLSNVTIQPAGASTRSILTGMLVCFDIEFPQPLRALLSASPPVVLTVPSAWLDTPPVFTAAQFQQAAARSFGRALLMANSQGGGGIYDVDGTVLAAAPSAPFGKPPQLLMAKLAGARRSVPAASGAHVPPVRAVVQGSAAQPCNASFLRNAACARLSSAPVRSALLSVSHGGLQCRLNYTTRTTGAAASLVLLAFNGTLRFDNTPSAFPLSTCALLQCTTLADCQPTAAAVHLDAFRMTGTFDSGVRLLPMFAAQHGKLLPPSAIRFSRTSATLASAGMDVAEAAFGSALLYGLRSWQSG